MHVDSINGKLFSTNYKVARKEAKLGLSHGGKMREEGMWHTDSNEKNWILKLKWNEPISKKAIWICTTHHHNRVIATSPGTVKMHVLLPNVVRFDELFLIAILRSQSIAYRWRKQPRTTMQGRKLQNKRTVIILMDTPAIKQFIKALKNVLRICPPSKNANYSILGHKNVLDSRDAILSFRQRPSWLLQVAKHWSITLS